MARHFADVRAEDFSGGGTWRTLGLYFERAASPPPRDKQVDKLVQRFETLVEKLHLLASTEDEFMEYLGAVETAAKASLATDGGRVSDGDEAVSRLERALLALWRKKRTQYLTTMAKIAGLLCVVGFGLAWLVSAFAPDQSAWLLPAVLVLPGSGLGVLILAFTTNRMPSYQFLGEFDAYRFEPWQRYLWVVLLSLLVLAAMKYRLVVVNLGVIKSDEFESHADYGFVIGLACGVAEALIADSIMKTVKSRAADILSRHHSSS